jgi:hypothetical protein
LLQCSTTAASNWIGTLHTATGLSVACKTQHSLCCSLGDTQACMHSTFGHTQGAPEPPAYTVHVSQSCDLYDLVQALQHCCVSLTAAPAAPCSPVGTSCSPWGNKQQQQQQVGHECWTRTNTLSGPVLHPMQHQQTPAVDGYGQAADIASLDGAAACRKMGFEAELQAKPQACFTSSSPPPPTCTAPG